MADPKYLLWYDYETTGLWEAADEPPTLLEMAAILLPFGDLNPANSLAKIDVVFGAPEHTLQAMDSFVVDMHVKNGLLEQVRRSKLEPRHAESALLEAFEVLDVKAQECALAGSGIAAFDVPLTRLYMFNLYEHVHYAPFDIGTGRRMSALLWPEFPKAPQESESNHRAMDDVLSQLEEARWYRENVVLGRVDHPTFPTSGPTTMDSGYP